MAMISLGWKPGPLWDAGMASSELMLHNQEGSPSVLCWSTAYFLLFKVETSHTCLLHQTFSPQAATARIPLVPYPILISMEACGNCLTLEPIKVCIHCIERQKFNRLWGLEMEFGKVLRIMWDNWGGGALIKPQWFSKHSETDEDSHTLCGIVCHVVLWASLRLC